MTRVHVIIIGYRGDAWLPGCIETLRGVTVIPFKLFLVDNAYNSCMDELPLAGLDHCIIRCEQPLGFAEANNHALVRGGLEADYVCFLNQDTLSGEDWLTACVECLEADPRRGATVPLTTTYDGTGWDAAFLACARQCGLPEEDLAGGRAPAWAPAAEVPAAAMVIRGEVLRRTGPFDPIFGSYYEDYDLCRRVREAGYEVGICGGGRVRHYSGSATSSKDAEWRRARQLTRNQFIYDLRCAGQRRKQQALSYLCKHFPRNLTRSISGRPAAKPPGPFLTAHMDLLKLAPRLLTARADQAAWTAYLLSIGWPDATETMRFRLEHEQVIAKE